MGKKRGSGQSALEAPTALVLYRTPSRWRFSMAGPDGIACGALDDPGPDCEPEVAQAALVRRVEELTEQVLDVVWRPAEQPGWWTGEVTT